MIKEQLNFVVSCLEFEGKISPFEKSLVLRDFNEFEVETFKSIEGFETSGERARFLHFVYVMLIKPNITRLSAIQGSNEAMREYYSFALQRYRDAKDIVFLVIGMIQKTPDSLRKYFPDPFSTERFTHVLEHCNLLDGNGNLKGRHIRQFREIFLAACKAGLTKKVNYSESEQLKIIKEIAGAYSRELKTDSIKKAFNERDMETFGDALGEFEHFPPH